MRRKRSTFKRSSRKATLLFAATACLGIAAGSAMATTCTQVPANHPIFMPTPPYPPAPAAQQSIIESCVPGGPAISPSNWTVDTSQGQAYYQSIISSDFYSYHPVHWDDGYYGVTSHTLSTATSPSTLKNLNLFVEDSIGGYVLAPGAVEFYNKWGLQGTCAESGSPDCGASNALVHYGNLPRYTAIKDPVLKADLILTEFYTAYVPQVTEWVKKNGVSCTGWGSTALCYHNGVLVPGITSPPTPPSFEEWGNQCDNYQPNVPESSLGPSNWVMDTSQGQAHYQSLLTKYPSPVSWNQYSLTKANAGPTLEGLAFLKWNPDHTAYTPVPGAVEFFNKWGLDGSCISSGLSDCSAVYAVMNGRFLPRYAGMTDPVLRADIILTEYFTGYFPFATAWMEENWAPGKSPPSFEEWGNTQPP